MDSSKIEECRSSESGWTLYIDSSSTHGSEDDGRSENANVYYNNDDDDDDDSMVSDASSGPSHRHGTKAFCSKHEEDDGEEEDEKDCCFPDKKGKKSIEKQKLGSKPKNKQDKEVEKQTKTPLKAKRASSDPIRTGSKVRQSIWFGKRN